MKTKVLHISIVAVIIAVMLLAALPLAVRGASEDIPTITETLDKGWVRVSPTTTQRVVSMVGTKATMEILVTPVPVTLDDNKTLIDNKWYKQVDPSGQWWFENGNNIFKARITAERVSVLDKNGKLSRYTSVLSLEESYKNGTPEIVDDPLTGTVDTCLKWDYGKYGKNATLTRYLRSSNDRLSELWVLTGVPKSSIIFRPNIEKEAQYGADIIPVAAFDAKYHAVNVSQNLSKGFYVINPADLSNITYPLYVDPTYNFSSSNSDAWISRSDGSYSTAQAATTGTVVDGDYPSWIGQSLTAGSYQVDRSYITFDTSTILPSWTVTAANLYLFGYADWSTNDFNVYVASGQPTYPHDPTVAADYNRAYYTSDTGSGFNTSSTWNTVGYNYVTINNTGFITKGGMTKLALRSSRDISATSPTTTTSGQTKMSMIYYGNHTSGIDAQILAAKPGVLIDNTPAGYWGGNCNSATFQAQGIKVYSYITASYGVFDLATNLAFVDAIAAEGTYGVFLDEIEASPASWTYYQQIYARCTQKGVYLMINPGTPYINASLYSVADFVMTDEQYTGRSPTTIESSHLSQTVVVGYGVADATTAAAYTQVAWNTGYAYSYHNNGTKPTEWNTLPSWLSTYIALLGSTGTIEERVAYWQEEHGMSTVPQLTLTATTTITPPTLTTNPASNIGTTGVTLNGYLTSVGGGTCSVRFQYGTTTSYGTETSWVGGYTAIGAFNASITGLIPGTTYHYRAVASNSAGTGTGIDVTFTTAPLLPSFFAGIAGNVQVSLSWVKGTGANKTVVLRKAGSYPANPTDGTVVYNNTGTTHLDTPLTNGTLYFYSAWSLAVDNVTYSLAPAQVSATPIALGAPSVTTGSASNVGVGTATLQGILSSLGGYATADTYFDYGLTTAYGSSTAPVTQTGTTVFAETIGGLAPATPYHYRAAASGAGGTTNGIDATFTTSGNSAPVMATNAATGVQINAVQLNGTVTSDGGSPPVTVWFEYGLTTAYEIGDTPTAAGLVTGSTFYYGLGALSANTLYHYRSVGQNALGTTYGGDQSFTTGTATAPTVTTNPATAVGAVQATLQGALTSAGGSTCTLTFEYGTTIAYGSTTAATPATGSTGVAFSAIVTGLTTGVTYHYRAVATNGGGTGNGTDATFVTVFGAPTSFTARAVSSTTINLSWVLQGDQTFVSYKTTGYPVDRLDGTQLYFGQNTYVTASGLTPGTTYYFSAWSWKSGNIWTTANATAIATTFASTNGNAIPDATVPAGQEPVSGSSWFDVPSTAVVRNFPLYDVMSGWATAYQLPEGTFWAFVVLALSVLIGAIIFVAWKQAVPAVAGSILVVVIAGIIGACPPILAIFIGTIEIGGAYGLMSLGANITGRGT